MIVSVCGLLLVGLTAVYAQNSEPYYTSTPASYYPTGVPPAAPAPAPYPNPPYSPYRVAPVPVPVPVPVVPGYRHLHVIPRPYAVAHRSGSPEGQANIVQEYRDVGFDGNFNYGFDSDNQISVKSRGYIKPPTTQNEEPIQVIEGSYSYVDTEGKPKTVNYIADEGGYRTYGDGVAPPAEVQQQQSAQAQAPAQQ